jgi:hypothetical protein
VWAFAAVLTNENSALGELPRESTLGGTWIYARQHLLRYRLELPGVEDTVEHRRVGLAQSQVFSFPYRYCDAGVMYSSRAPMIIDNIWTE